MECEYCDCKNEGTNKCLMCVNGSKYEQIKKKTYGIKKNYNKQSNRMGSKAEKINHESNAATISSSMTPNSGAGKVKGDEQIVGLVNIMHRISDIAKRQGFKKIMNAILRDLKQMANKDYEV